MEKIKFELTQAKRQTNHQMKVLFHSKIRTYVKDVGKLSQAIRKMATSVSQQDITHHTMK